VTESADAAKAFTIWAIDERSVQAEAAAMMGLPEGDDFSSRENPRPVSTVLVVLGFP
jgi:hypothetical protein